MDNILTISYKLKSQYEAALHCITGYFSYQVKDIFVNYILKQHNIFDLEEKAKENTRLVQEKLETCVANNPELFCPNTIISVEQTTRILGKEYCLNTPLFEEYNLITDSLDTTIHNLDFVNRQFVNKDSPSILGNNWRLQKAFPSLKASKTKNNKYVLPEPVITDIISNYFLYIKFYGKL